MLVDGPDGPVRVGVASSPMAVLDQLSLHQGERLVVVTDVGERDLGADLLSRAWRERVVAPDPWGAVALTFRVTRAGAVDPLLVKEGEEVAQVLLDLAPSGGWPAPASGIVTRDHALRSLATHVLGTPRDLDAAGLLEWSRDPAGGLSLRDLPARARDALVRWAVERCGEGAAPVLRLAVAGHGTEALHLGLVIHLALRVAGGGVAKGAVGARLGRPVVPEHALSAWGELCHAWALRQLETDRSAALRVLADADAEAAELQLGPACVESDLLPSGLLASSASAPRPSPTPRPVQASGRSRSWRLAGPVRAGTPWRRRTRPLRRSRWPFGSSAGWRWTRTSHLLPTSSRPCAARSTSGRGSTGPARWWPTVSVTVR